MVPNSPRWPRSVRGPLAAALQPPAADALVVSRKQDLRHVPAAIGGRARVVRVLGVPAERRAERLLDDALRGTEGPGQLAQHGIGDDHRSQLAARQDVAPDRDRVGREMLADPLVDTLIAPAQQGQIGLGGELRGQLLVEDPARRGEQHDAATGEVLSVGGAQRGVDDVDAQNHPRAAPVRSVVDLPGAQWSRVAVVEQPQLAAVPQRVLDVALGGEPLERLRKEGENVEPHVAGYSRISTTTRRSARVAEALAMVRSALAIRPPRPITRPRSSSATVISSTMSPFSSVSSTLTASGSSTSDRARNSFCSRIAAGGTPLVGARRLDALGAQQYGDRLRGLRPMVEPVARPLLVDRDHRGIGLRVVLADRLDRPPVAGRAAVGDDHAPDRILARPDPSETDSNCHAGREVTDRPSAAPGWASCPRRAASSSCASDRTAWSAG